MARTLLEYLYEDGRSPFGRWLDGLAAPAAARVTAALYRLEAGPFGNTKSVGGGVCEYRVNFGPGYRIYFGQDGDSLVILLAGGTKKRQQQDIELARSRWQDYKRRKRAGR